MLCALALPGAAHAVTPHPAVARIAVAERGGQAFGSGTLIDVRDRYGLVVTNWHVVEAATGTIEVTFPSGFKSEARALKLDETWDLAALVIWRPPTQPVAIAQSPPKSGDRLTICGYGKGDYRAISGRCQTYYSPKTGYPQEIVELDVEARQGDSGGPIFNQRGELAGVLFGAGRGTTLGSFGPRVERFLATLSPGAGRGGPVPAAMPESHLTASPPASPPEALPDQQAPEWSAVVIDTPPGPPTDLPELTGPSSGEASIDWVGEGKTLAALAVLAFLLMQGARLIV